MPDEQVAPGVAIPACVAAVAADGSNATLQFELGRAQWIGGRDAEAVGHFALAADAGHAAAMKYIGDAYLEGRGLPAGVEANISTAADWYAKAEKAGFADASAALKEANDQIRRSRFDKNVFVNGTFMETIYTKEFARTKAPLSLAYYAQGVVDGLESQVPQFNDQACTPMIGMLGRQIVDAAKLAAVIAEAARDDGDDPATKAAKLAVQYATGNYFIDQGKRDATVLANKDVLGCDSAVSRKIVENIMVTSSGNRAF